MNKNIIKYIGFGLVALLCLVIFIMVYSGNKEGGSNLGIILAYTVMFIASIAAIALSVVNLAKNPRALKVSLISAGALLVIFLIGYFTSSGEIMTKWEEMGAITSASQVKRISGVIVLAYILFGAAIVGIAYSEIKSLLS